MDWQDDDTCRLEIKAENASMAIYLDQASINWLAKELKIWPHGD